jgi:hypothetical protein
LRYSAALSCGEPTKILTPGRESPPFAGDSPGSPVPAERWPMAPYAFSPFKHNRVVAALALRILELRTRGLEKLIFTATTGRSGTLTLARLFSAVPDCIAVHEGHPIMHGPVLRAASFGDTALVNRVYRQIKSVNILRAAAGHRYYLEANHLFIKTFIQNAVQDFGERMVVIHLVRPAVEVATSIYCLNDCPGTERGNYWWLDYRAPNNLLPMADILESTGAFSHPFYKALWYWHEVEARIAAWRARMPTLKFVRFETHWFNDLNKVSALLDELGIRYASPPIKAVIGAREHIKEHQKLLVPLPAELAREMASRFEELLGRLDLPRPLALGTVRN